MFRTGWWFVFGCIGPNVGFVNLNWIAPMNVTRRQTLSVGHKCFITAARLKNLDHR